jgi:hypothetical protein
MADPLEINTTVTHAGQAPVVETKTIPVPPVATVTSFDTGTTLIDTPGALQSSKQTVQGHVTKA